jgi:hypothetical protein
MPPVGPGQSSDRCPGVKDPYAKIDLEKTLIDKGNPLSFQNTC